MHIWKAIASVAVLAALSGLACAADASGRFITGVGASLHDGEQAIHALQWLSVGSVRIDVPWKLVETAPGVYAIPADVERLVNEALAVHVQPLIILGYFNTLYCSDKPHTAQEIDAFGRYAQFVVQHFSGRVRYFDLWNEWEARTGATTPGTPEDYVALATRVYPVIKAANPGAVVLSGGISDIDAAGLGSGWIARFLALGGLRYVDALSVHLYNFQLQARGTPEAAIRLLDAVHTLALDSAARAPVSVYVTEMGYPSFSGKGGVTPDQAAAYLERFMLLAATRDYVPGVWWYGLRDQGIDPANKEHHFGVFDVQFAPKPAAYALRSLVELLRGSGRPQLLRDDAQIQVSAMGADGHRVLYSWREVPVGPGSMPFSAEAGGVP